MKFGLKLKSVSYSGASIGRDIRLEVNVLGKTLRLDKRIRPGTVFKPDSTIGIFDVMHFPLETTINIEVIEKDLIFSDRGNISGILKIDDQKDLPRRFEYTITVVERRKIFWKSKAIFTIFIEARLASPTVDDPKWTGDFREDSPEMILARVIFGEARSTRLSDAARIGVAWAIRNRKEDVKQRWGNTYHDVILQKGQFSAFNEHDRNRLFVEDLLHTGKEIDKKAWQNCYRIAIGVIRGEMNDPTKGSNHYYDESLHDNPPSWATKGTFKVKIDRFYFHAL